MAKIEVVEQEAGSDAELATDVLAHAKKWHESHGGSSAPMFLIFEDGKPTPHPFSPEFVDWNDWRMRDLIANGIRLAIKTWPGPPITAVAFVSDTFQRSIRKEYDQKDLKARGLDFVHWHDWSSEDQAKYIQKREALIVTISTMKGDTQVAQFYKRLPGDVIEWEEFNQYGSRGGGRFYNLIGRPHDRGFDPERDSDDGAQS